MCLRSSESWAMWRWGLFSYFLRKLRQRVGRIWVWLSEGMFSYWSRLGRGYVEDLAMKLITWSNLSNILLYPCIQINHRLHHHPLHPIHGLLPNTLILHSHFRLHFTHRLASRFSNQNCCNIHYNNKDKCLRAIKLTPLPLPLPIPTPLPAKPIKTICPFRRTSGGHSWPTSMRSTQIDLFQRKVPNTSAPSLLPLSCLVASRLLWPCTSWSRSMSVQEESGVSVLGFTYFIWCWV